jgi:hypothetical protein
MATAAPAKKSNAVDPKWVKNSMGQFSRLTLIDPEHDGIRGVTGIYVVWHGGVQPRWITVGKSKDLGLHSHRLCPRRGDPSIPPGH